MTIELKRIQRAVRILQWRRGSKWLFSHTACSFSEFSSSQETWTPYIEHLEQYLAANKVEDADKQRAIRPPQCLWSLQHANYRLICSLVSPKKPAEFKFKEITEIVQKHHDPKPSVIVQRYRFNTRHRHAVGESVVTYVAELRYLSNHCDFGPSLQQMLRDRLVCGIGDPKYSGDCWQSLI